VGNVAALLHRWAEDAKALETRYFEPTRAMLVSLHIEELQAALRADDERTVTLSEAVKLTGFSASTLSRHIRDGSLSNGGTAARIRLRVGDLPKKALRATTNACTLPSQREQIARAAVTPFRRGANG
jgi:hypothetical protein